MYDHDDKENPFTLDPSLKSLLTFKEQEKNVIPKEEYFENPHDRLYYTGKEAAQYGLIKRLEAQAFGLSEVRNQIITGDKRTSNVSSNTNVDRKPASAGSRRTELPDIQSKKKPTINQYVKEKKETFGEFLNKGKQIFLEKMMMELKKEETQRLSEFIINEDETLNEHEADFREHLKFSETFIQDLTREADQIGNLSKAKGKEIERENKKLAQLEQQSRTLDSQIKKKEEEKETYEKYKKFFKELYEPAAKSLKQVSQTENKIENAAKVFLTQKDAEEGVENKSLDGKKDEDSANELQFDNPKQIVELLKRLDDATIFLIHNQQEKEEDLDKTRRAFKIQMEQIEKKHNDRKTSLNQVQKLFDKLEKEKNQAQEKLNRLKLAEKAPQNNLIENGGLDTVKITSKIRSMCSDLVDEKLARETGDDPLKMMDLLERELEQLIKFYNETKVTDQNLKALNELERELTKERRQEKALAQQRLDREKYELALEKQKNKKVVIRKGRRTMKKMLLKTEKEDKEVIDEDADKNDDEKYFKDNFTFMDSSKVKPKSLEEI